MKQTRIIALFTALVLLLCALPALAEDMQLKQVTILSRHNLRAPLSSNGSVPEELTPHQWIEWTGNSSELTLKGGVLETRMGQYFRKYLESAGLIPENWVPEDGQVLFMARDKQRCTATARYFATGMLPMANTTVEKPGEVDIFKPVLHYFSDAYADAAIAQLGDMIGQGGFKAVDAQFRDAIALVMKVSDMQDSEIYKSGKYGDLMADTSTMLLEADKEPDFAGPIKTACQVADALLLQYYESPDPVAAAFGHDMTDADWAAVGNLLARFYHLRHGAPLVAVNIANPLIKTLREELEKPGRLFSFLCGHDVNIVGVLSALGVQDYELPDTLETYVPIGAKLVFERYENAAGDSRYDVSLIYQSLDQLRNVTELTLKNPPMKYSLSFEGIERGEDGCFSEADVLLLFDRAIAAYDNLESEYALPNAA